MSSVRRIAFALATAASVSGALLVLGPAAAAPGDLDPTFGSDGLVRTNVGLGSANGLVLQPDGKIVLAGSPRNGGNMTLARYLPDGSLDSSFGSGGIVVGPRGAAYAIALQADGNIVVAGSSSDFGFLLARFLPDGSPDTTFGANGVLSGAGGIVLAIALQPDGDIVAAGYGRTDPFGTRDSFFLARFNPFGVLDPGFGENGVVHTEIGDDSGARSIVIQADGKIVAAGYSTISPSRTAYSMVALARYLFDGTLDRAFGSNGTAIGPPSPGVFSATASDLELQTNGNLVVAGTIDNRIAVARFLPDGSLDATFGVRGVTALPTSSWNLSAEDVALQADGRIVVAGSASSGNDTRFGVVRYEPEGTPDRRFGYLGVATSSFVWSSGASSVALQSDGRILAAGGSSGPEGAVFALARFLVTTPSTITARPLVVEYGRPIRLRGHLTSGQRAPLAILGRGCRAARTSKVGTLTAGRKGTWTATVRPRTRTTFWAEVGRERTWPKIVRVSPRLTLERVSAGTLRARALFGTSLAGEVLVTLQRYSRGRWLDLQSQHLWRIARRSSGVVSGATFHVRRRAGRRLRIVVPRDTSSFRCFAKGVSKAIRG